MLKHVPMCAQEMSTNKNYTELSIIIVRGNILHVSHVQSSSRRGQYWHLHSLNFGMSLPWSRLSRGLTSLHTQRVFDPGAPHVILLPVTGLQRSPSATSTVHSIRSSFMASQLHGCSRLRSYLQSAMFLATKSPFRQEPWTKSQFMSYGRIVLTSRNRLWQLSRSSKAFIVHVHWLCTSLL